MMFLVYTILFFISLYLLFRKLTTKEDFPSYALLFFFLYFGLRVGRIVKVENWEVIYEFLFLAVLFMYALFLHTYLPTWFNTRGWQTFFVGGLILEEWFLENFPFSLLPVGIFSFSFGAWWSFFGANVFIYLFLVFILTFYFHLKNQFFESKILLEYEEENKKRVLFCPTGKDLMDLVNFVSIRAYNQEVKNHLGSRLSSASFPQIGKRFFAGRPQNLKEVFEYATTKIGIVFGSIVGCLGISYGNNRIDNREATLHLARLRLNTVPQIQVEIDSKRELIEQCSELTGQFATFLKMGKRPCFKYQDLLEEDLDLTFKLQVYKYCSEFKNAYNDPDALFVYWLSSQERIEAMESFKNFSTMFKRKNLVLYETYVSTKVYPKLIENYVNGFPNPESAGWEKVPSFTIPDHVIDLWKLEGGIVKEPSVSALDNSSSGNFPSVEQKPLALPSSRASSIAQDEGFFSWVYSFFSTLLKLFF